MPETLRIKIARIAHVYYRHKKIESALAFLRDFGFQETKRVGRKVYFRGTGPEPFVYCAEEGDEDAFGGAAFVVETEADLEAAQQLPGAGEIYDLKDAPGGGRCVTLLDPVDHFPFHLVYGQELLDDVKPFPQLKYNFVSCGPFRLSSHITKISSSQRRNTDQATRPSDSRKVRTIYCNSYVQNTLCSMYLTKFSNRARACAQTRPFWHVCD